MGWGLGAAAAISAVGGIAGGIFSGNAAVAASKEQAAAMRYAADLQLKMFEENKANLQPFTDAGKSVLPDLQTFYKTSDSRLSTAYDAAQAQLPHALDQQSLNATPGYQFNLANGLKAIQASATARGLGISGTALKSGANFATGLANSTYAQQLANQNLIYGAYSNQFANRLNQQQLVGGQLQNVAALGENAAATTGYQGNTAAANAGANIANAGTAIAQGIQAQGNGIGNALSSAGQTGANAISSYYGLQYLNQLAAGKNGGSPVTGSDVVSPQASYYDSGNIG